MLHAINKKGWERTAWCVPSAVSIITGAPLGHTHSRAAFMTNQKLEDVEGVHVGDAILLLKEQGYSVRSVDLKERFGKLPTLAKFMKEREPFEKAMPMIICIDDSKGFAHMVTAHYDYICDNQTMKPVLTKDYHYKRKYVTFAAVVMKD